MPFIIGLVSGIILVLLLMCFSRTMKGETFSDSLMWHFKINWLQISVTITVFFFSDLCCSRLVQLFPFKHSMITQVSLITFTVFCLSWFSVTQTFNQSSATQQTDQYEAQIYSTLLHGQLHTLLPVCPLFLTPCL